MATTTKTTSAMSKTSKPTRSKLGALRMFRGVVGRRAVTRYNCSTVEKARSNRVNLLVVNQSGEEIVAPARLCHRPDLFGVYSNASSNIEADTAGTGKYIQLEGWNKNETQVVGAQYVMPYLAGKKCYASILAAFYDATGRKSLNSLTADAMTSPEDGEHLAYQGKKITGEDCVLISPPLSEDELWDRSRALNAKLSRGLGSVKSKKKGVKEHLPARDKFGENIGVMRRMRDAFNIATGEFIEGGGVTPFGMPIGQADMCIDKRYLTDGFTVENGEVIETGRYYYLLAWGRTVPHDLPKTDWWGLGDTDRIAFKSEKIRQEIITARRKIA